MKLCVLHFAGRLNNLLLKFIFAEFSVGFTNDARLVVPSVKVILLISWMSHTLLDMIWLAVPVTLKSLKSLLAEMGSKSD